MSIAERTITARPGSGPAPMRVVSAGRAPEPPGRPDTALAAAAVADLLAALGRDVTSPHLADTPRRVAEAFIEMLTPTDFSPTTFPNDEGYTELVLVQDFPFHSLCEHHLLPFQGVANIGYLPGDRILGLSKLARVRGSRTTTSALRGAIRDDQRTRDEFLARCGLR